MQAAQASRVRRPTWPLEFGLPSLCATISLLCGSARRNCSRLLVYHAPTRPAVGPGSMDRAVLCRRPVRLVAGLRRPRLCCNGHRICLLLRGDAAVRRSRSSGIPLRTLWRPDCLLAGCSYLPCISDLRDWNKYFCVVSSWRHRGHYRHSAGARCLCRAATSRCLAGLSHVGRNLGDREIFTVLLCLNVALAAFVLIRKVPGIGYNIGWGRRWGFYVMASFVVFAAIAIPLGEAMHFIRFAPQWQTWRSLPFLSIAILFFTAWPEEFLFRGLLQNLLSRSSKSDLAGWWTASVLFGFSHITNMGFPNWRYMILASIAGIFYGWTWR